MTDSEETVIVWLRSPSKRKFPVPEDRLHCITKDVRLFDDAETCVTCILDLRDETVFLVLGHDRISAVSTVLKCTWVACIYLLEFDSNAPDLHNMRGVFCDPLILLAQLQADILAFQGTSAHLAFCSQGKETSAQMVQQNEVQFLWSQILLDIVLQLRISVPSASILKDLLEECRLCYRDDPTELARIMTFELTYTPDTVLQWYTGDTFVYRLLNRALRVRNVSVIFKFKTIIQDMYDQLKSEHEKQMARTGMDEYVKNSVRDFKSGSMIL